MIEHAFFGKSGMVTSAGAIIRSLMFYGHSAGSAGSGLERARRCVEHVSPTPPHFPRNRHWSTSPDKGKPCAWKANTKASHYDQKA